MIFEQLKDIIMDQMDIDEECITMEADFVDDLHADSLDITLLMKTISDEFDIAFEDEAVDHISTIGDAVQYIGNFIKE